ncbi:MAG: gamma-glutamyltransferase [Deltaproteobacteria bacterium]|nr:gamma-glutamyltransferase [Deltaproteobacteria bacterium]
MSTVVIPELRPGQTVRPEIRGRRGVISAGKSFAVAAGMRVFARGGNAIDAGIAAVLAAAVTEISHFGFGGECPVAIHEGRSGRSYVIPGLGPAPMLATPGVFAPQGFIDFNGPRACTVPAVVDSVCSALGASGSLSLGDVIEPAIELARGFPVYETLHRHLVDERAACIRFPSTAAAYYPNGDPTPVGSLFRQPDLAATFSALVDAESAARRAGLDRRAALSAVRDAFYLGDIGATIAAAVEREGGLLRREDLVRFRGRAELPVVGRYRGATILKGGFWCQGPALLLALGILDGIDLPSMGAGSADAIHFAVEALKLALDDRDAHFGDPDHVTIPHDTLLSDAYHAARRSLIDANAAALEHRPGLGAEMPRTGGSWLGSGDTTAVSAADADGNLFCAVPSSGWLLGGAFIAAGTGIPMGNRMQSFVLDPRRPNCLAPGKRPRMTLTPTLVLLDGKPWLAIGTPGGDSQEQQILQVLSGLLDHRLPLQRAIEAPRFNSEHAQSSFAFHTDQPGVLSVETTLAEGTRRELARRGHRLREVGAFGMATGMTAAGIERSGTLRAGADPRGERYALGD